LQRFANYQNVENYFHSILKVAFAQLHPIGKITQNIATYFGVNNASGFEKNDPKMWLN
jgi:hypothetical protein